MLIGVCVQPTSGIPADMSKPTSGILLVNTNPANEKAGLPISESSP